MNTVRRATPDSEALVSSEDERPWPSSTTFGTLPRKETGVPGLPGGIWSATKRGSMKMGDAAKRNIMRDVRLGAPIQPHANGVLRSGNSPSPAQSSEGAGQLPFSIPLQPTAKATRSLSHSQGQREMMQASQPTAGDHALPLGLLTEEDAFANETDSDFGGQLTYTTSQPPMGMLHRTSTMPTTTYRNTSHGYASGRNDLEDHKSVATAGRKAIDAAFTAGLAIEQPHRRPAQWQSHLGWDDLPPMPNESRRHSLADIPTRRGSLDLEDSAEGLAGWRYGLQTQRDRRWDDIGQPGQETYRRPMGAPSHTSSTTTSSLAHNINNNSNTTQISSIADMRFHDDEKGVQFNMPPTYKVPYVELGDENAHGRQYPRDARPRKMLYIVSFKCSRVDVFYLHENTGLHVRAGDIVIVEADRGQDLGTVQHADVTNEQAKQYKKKYSEEQYKWLMMFSRNNAQGNVNPNAQYADINRNPMLANAPTNIAGATRESGTLKPKAIKRLASPHEVKMLAEKEGNEAKAKRTCQQKVAHLHLEMEILDAEFQWDFQKVIFYYYADKYINFKDLITELYRIYKSRIWLSAVNPASFSQHAMGQPPSGIGPGAITVGDHAFNPLTYAPIDPDPYGAVRPYQISPTYSPNFSGMINSFAPENRAPATNDPNSPYPAVAPNTAMHHNGNLANYNFFYDRTSNHEHLPPQARPYNGFPYHGALPPEFVMTGVQPAIPHAYNVARGVPSHHRTGAAPANGQPPPSSSGFGAQQSLWLNEAYGVRAAMPRDPNVDAQILDSIRNLSIGGDNHATRDR